MKKATQAGAFLTGLMALVAAFLAPGRTGDVATAVCLLAAALAFGLLSGSLKD